MTLAQKLVLGGRRGSARQRGEVSRTRSPRSIRAAIRPMRASATSRCSSASSRAAPFIRFLASDREDCYARMRVAVGDNTGVWSKHDRGTMHLAQLGR